MKERITNRGLMAILLVGIILALSSAMASAQDASTITLTSPIEREVFQRDAKNMGVVRIEGTVPKETVSVEYRFVAREEATCGETTPWGILLRAEDIHDGVFLTTRTLPAGGWYALEMNARTESETLASTRVKRIGVGDIFVAAGDMTAANFGKSMPKAEDDRVVFYTGHSYVPADVPLPGAAGISDGGSVWPLVGDMLARSSQVPVCFVGATLTWTRIEFWLPEAKYNVKLYDNLSKTVRVFDNNGGIRAVLWCHGDSDSLAATPAQVYFDRLKLLIDSVRKDAGYNVDWFVAHCSYHPYTKLQAEGEVRRGQEMSWEKGVAYPGPSLDNLIGKHFRANAPLTELGLRTLADRWYAAIWQQYQTLALTPKVEDEAKQ